MDFEKRTWVGGDTVTAAHLNRIEDGIEEALNGVEKNSGRGGGSFVVSLVPGESDPSGGGGDSGGGDSGGDSGK